MQDVDQLIQPILAMHDQVRETVVAACERAAIDDSSRSSGELSTVVDDGAGDTIYAIDRVSEAELIKAFEGISMQVPVVLIAEGFPSDGTVVLPAGTAIEDAAWRIIIDPIDGTRGLMYQKRSAWILTAVAPNRGPETSLSDVVFAAQTEIPVLKQHLCDQVWAVRGERVHAERLNRVTGERRELSLQPSRATSIAHGFATVARFFPGARAVLAALDDDVVAEVLGPVQAGKAQCFEDQYISTGGELYELMAGHDRFVADLRPLTERQLAEKGLALGLCCHPYDICTAMVAEELGVVVTGADGCALDAPLNLDAEVAWVGYANAAIRAQVEPALLQALRRYNLL
ncbi:MAG: inositol monophosphatase [Anaerolineae bacterium]